MTTSETTSTALRSLPAAISGDPGLQLFDADGELLLCVGSVAGTRVERTRDGLAVVAPAGRVAIQRQVDHHGAVAVVSLDARLEPSIVPFLDGFFAMLQERERVEEDMDSINSSSLALLEEISMVGDTLPTLPTGRSVDEVAEMGLRALVVAASVHRALYIQYDQATRYAEVLVQVEMDDAGRSAQRVPYGSDPEVPAGAAVVWDAIRGPGDAVLCAVPEDARLGAPGSPESLAERELIAVPVHYGNDDKRVLLGALLVMDKRDNAYSTSRQLGSHETKLATAVASMLGSVVGTRKVAELGNELRMANEIQQQILPDGPIPVEGFDLAGRCSNSGAVGGDYFDYLRMRDGSVLIVVADVSGHNLASGMVMVGARATLRTLASAQSELGKVFDDLARSLFDDLSRTERFITAVGATLRPASSEIELCNAGHNDSMLFRAATGEVERIPSDTTVLGFLPEPEHVVQRTVMAPGDVMLLYTDGVVEATSADGEMLGEERLVEVLTAAAAGTAAETLQAVFDAVDAFSGKGLAGDDVTAVVVKATPSEGVQQ